MVHNARRKRTVTPPRRRAQPSIKLQHTVTAPYKNLTNLHCFGKCGKYDESSFLTLISCYKLNTNDTHRSLKHKELLASPNGSHLEDLCS